MSEVVLQKLQYGDEDFLFHLMNSDQAIIDASLKSDYSKWKKMVEWAVKNPKDLFWKISVNDSGTTELKDAVECGYLGFTGTKGKLSLESIARNVVDTPEKKYLVLEIYILKEYRGRDIGTVAYNQAVEKIQEEFANQEIIVFASTYNTNTKAQRFFIESLGMELSHYYSHISTVFKKRYPPLKPKE